MPATVGVYPPAEELETLLINLCAGPQIDSLTFPDIEKSDFGEGAKFWTSTEALPEMFYFFYFVNGPILLLHGDGQFRSFEPTGRDSSRYDRARSHVGAASCSQSECLTCQV